MASEEDWTVFWMKDNNGYKRYCKKSKADRNPD